MAIYSSLILSISGSACFAKLHFYSVTIRDYCKDLAHHSLTPFLFLFVYSENEAAVCALAPEALRMPHNHRKSTLSRESSSSSTQSSRSSGNRKRSHKMSRNSRSQRHHTRDREDRHKKDVEDGVVGVGKRVYKTVEKLENPVKKLGKLVLWSAPLILAGLEVRHEWHHHIHKRRMMEKEYEKAHLEIQLQKEKDGKKEGITVEETKSHGPTQEREKDSAATPAPTSEEVHILPYPILVDRQGEYPRRHPTRRELEERDPYLLPPIAPEAPCQDMWEIRQPRIRVKQPGSREVHFPQVRSRSESVYEYRRW